MKKYILLVVVFIFSIVVLSNAKYETYAIEPIDVIPYGETLDDFTDFSISWLHGTTYVVDTVIWVINDDNLTNSRLLIRFRFQNSNLYVDIYQLNAIWVETPDDPYNSGYYKSLLLDSKLVINNIQWYDYRSLGFDVRDDNSSDTILDLVIYNIELGAFDMTYGNSLPNISFNGLLFDSITSQYNGVRLSQDFTIQVELLNALYYFWTTAGNQEAYELGLSHGIIEGYGEGYQYGETAGKSLGITEGFEQGRYTYGMYYNDVWYTADDWGELRHDVGYNKGLSTEIDWYTWASTFFLMPFRILNIQILPGIRIGYFALFSLLLGVVGWFFFIVGKGGGRKK